MLRVNAAAGNWVVPNRFAPGVRLQTHRHTGPVDGYTIAGRWHYLEYDFYSTAGSYIREPAGSVHTLDVPADNEGITEVLFMMEGSTSNLGPDGTVENVVDGTGTLEAYLAMCGRSGSAAPPASSSVERRGDVRRGPDANDLTAPLLDADLLRRRPLPALRPAAGRGPGGPQRRRGLLGRQPPRRGGHRRPATRPPSARARAS